MAALREAQDGGLYDEGLSAGWREGRTLIALTAGRAYTPRRLGVALDAVRRCRGRGRRTSSLSRIETPRGTLPMKTSRTMTAFAFFLITAAAFADSQGKVQPDPQKACRGGKPHELCFERPRDGLARVEYLSE